MKAHKAKLIMLIVLAIFVFFFSSDFGLIDIEKTSIITAIAIDKENDEYKVTAQIAVPEATDTNSENLKSQISGKGSTVGGAIKDLGDLSGWFPKLAFCNLIILGNGLKDENVIKVLDYFAKTLRVQDSALVAMSEKQAYKLLELATPLDNISSFALQKILLKNTGFDRDVSSTDVKTFCSGHYSISNSAIMPIIKAEPAGEEQSTSDKSSEKSGNSAQSSGGESKPSGDEKKNDNLFNAKTTALFKDGKMVGELDENLTFVYNALHHPFRGTTFPVDGINFNGQTTNYLLTVFRSTPKLKVDASVNDLTLNVSLNLYCKISDHSADGSEEALSQNTPLPDQVVVGAEEFFKSNIEKLVQKEIETECDFLRIKEKLYRFNNKQYSRYKDSFLSQIKSSVTVKVSGQK